MTKKTAWTIGVVTLATGGVVGVFIIGIFVGSNGLLVKPLNSYGFARASVAVVPSAQPTGVDLSPVWKAWNILDNRFVDAYATSTKGIVVGTSTATQQKKVWGLVSGVTDSMGDPYTVFLPPSAAKIFNADISGSFEGVGMEIAIRNKILTVVSPLKGTPAYKAGIKAGDRILFINKTSTKDMGVGIAVKLIRGKRGTKVVFTIIRDGERKLLKIAVVRDTIQIPTIKTTNRKDGIFVVELLNFSAKSAGLFRKAIGEFQKTGDKKLIIDLRGNPGGYLDAAVDIASWFLPAGDIVVTEDYGKNGTNRVHRSRGYDVIGKDVSLVVLIDRGSASAAEILSGSLKEYKRATLIGTRSFGKGSVQEVIPLTPDTSLKVTVARWLLAGDVFIAHNGIQPNIVVTIPKDAKPDGKKDYILDRAIQFLHTQ